MLLAAASLPAALLALLWVSTSYADGVRSCGSCVESWSAESIGPTKPQEPTEPGRTLVELGSIGKEVISDAAYLVTSPLRIDGKSALILGGVAAGIGGLMVVDKPLQRAFQENRTSAGDDIAIGLETAGFARTVLGANVALIGTGWLFREHKAGNRLMHTALVSLESQLFVEGIVGFTKFAVGRARPDTGEGVHSYEPFENFDKSFPSSHAARSFAVATVFADRYEQPVPLIAYTLATLISLSRIYQNEHFASDAVAGAALGFVVGKVLSWRHNQPDSRRWSVLPLVPEARGGLGLTVQVRF